MFFALRTLWLLSPIQCELCYKFTVLFPLTKVVQEFFTRLLLGIRKGWSQLLHPVWTVLCTPGSLPNLFKFLIITLKLLCLCFLLLSGSHSLPSPKTVQMALGKSMEKDMYNLEDLFQLTLEKIFSQECTGGHFVDLWGELVKVPMHI